MKNKLTVCLTGHRPNKLPWKYNEKQSCCIEFKNRLNNILEKAIRYGVKTFLTGMAEGFDMIATEILIELKKRYTFKIIAVIPCIGQEKYWSEQQQVRYHTLLKKCDNKIILNKNYTPSCMNERNLFMIKHSDIVIACFNGHDGGTKNTILLAQKQGLKIKIISPTI